MKKFKTRRSLNKVKVILLIMIFLLLFIILSFCKLNDSYHELTNILLNNFNENQENVSIRFLTNNLDNLLMSYAFKEERILYHDIKPTIYLYNTHDNERYSDNTTIYDATALLKNNLTKLGINVIQEEKKTSELLHTGLTDYEISRSFIKDIMQKEKNIAYYIDVHRDSVDNTTIKINDKLYAKVLFVLGLENKNYQKNKEVMIKMNEYLNTFYPGISKGIYEKQGSGVNGIYNEDLNENVILLEIGGVKNNFEEVNNSTEIIALMLYHMLGD